MFSFSLCSVHISVTGRNNALDHKSKGGWGGWIMEALDTITDNCFQVAWHINEDNNSLYSTIYYCIYHDEGPLTNIAVKLSCLPQLNYN